MTHVNTMRRGTALALALCVLAPTLAGCGSKGSDSSAGGGGGTMTSNPAPTPAATPNPGLSGKQKVVLLAGAALLYYIYKKDKANNAAATGAQNGGKPQLYREEKGPNKGAIYYRKNDAAHTVVWVTAPNQPVAVPADQVQQYAPDYQQYGNQAPTVPAGAQTQPYNQYDPSVAGGPPGPGQ